MFLVEAIQLLEVALDKARVERDVQEATMTFFKVLSEEFQPGFFVRDTSSSGLKNPMAKPDIILLAENEVSRLLRPPDFVSAYLCVPFSQPLWSCLASFFELKHSIQPKDQYESAVGQTSDRVQIIIKQQPWRKRVVAFVMGRETVEAFSYPGASGGDILKTGALPLFSSLGSAGAGIASGMQLLLRVFLSSLDQLGYRAPTVPSDFSVPCGQLRNFQCLRRVVSSADPHTQSLASSVFGATLDRPDGDPIKVVAKFGEGLEQEVRHGLRMLFYISQALFNCFGIVHFC